MSWAAVLNAADYKVPVGESRYIDTYQISDDFSGNPPAVGFGVAPTYSRNAWTVANGIGTINSGSDLSITYGMDSNIFVYQFDAVQSTDRIDMGFGSGATTNHANANGATFFIRGSNFSGTWQQIGKFVSNESGVINTPNPQKVGEWANYTLIINKELGRARIYLNDIFRVETDIPENSSFAYFSLGNNRDNKQFDNLQIGAKTGWKAVAVGNSSLIDEMDYSDSFNCVDRATKYLGNPDETGVWIASGITPWGNNDYYQLEYVRDGLANARWSGNFSVQKGANYDLGSTSYGKYDSYAGADTGFSQTGTELNNYFDYNGIRDQFVIQCDMIQTTDRCGFGVGSGSSIKQGDKGFSIFFRRDESAIGIYVQNESGGYNEEHLISSSKAGIAFNQWNNYAMRVDGLNMEVELFANEVSLGTFDLTQYGLTEIDARKVGYTSSGGNRHWTDNFQIGAVKTNGVTVGTSSLFKTGDLQKFEMFRGTTTNTWLKDGAAMPDGFTIVKDSDGLFPGSMAGSGTGAAVLEDGALYTTALRRDDSVYIQTDAYLPTANGALGLVFSSDGTDKALGLQFGKDNTFALFQGGIETDVTSQLTFSGDLSANEWYNFALYVNTVGNTLEAFVNEESIGTLSLANFDFATMNYAGLYANGGGFADNFQLAVPEPAAWMLLILGVMGGYYVRRKK